MPEIGVLRAQWGPRWETFKLSNFFLWNKSMSASASPGEDKGVADVSLKTKHPGQQFCHSAVLDYEEREGLMRRQCLFNMLITMPGSGGCREE